MKICYIPIGSFCYPKMIIRETNREISESLPFDFNSTPHLDSITNILKILKESSTYNMEFKEIIEEHNTDELAVSELNNMYIVHFFKKCDLKNDILIYPVLANYLKDDIVENVKNKFKKRFERLYNILNDVNNIICFLRIENYDNCGWKYELQNLVNVLNTFDNPNKYLIYAQKLIDDSLDYKITNNFNYDYGIPIIFNKHYYYDYEIINNKNTFIELLEFYENIINSNNTICIKNNNIIEKYYLDRDNKKIYKLTNINFFSYYHTCNDYLYINNVINGYDLYEKKDNIYEKV